MSRLLPYLFLPIVLAVALGVSFIAPQRTSAAVIPLGQQGCPVGQVVGIENLARDGNFAEAYSGAYSFTTELVEREPGIYPSDPPGGFSIQRGPVSYQGDSLVGRPFEGDPSREVPASETYFYSNPFLNNDENRTLFFIDGEGLLWRQSVPVSPNTTYNFYAYFDNLLIPGSSANDPVIELRVDDDPTDATPAVDAGPPITVTKEPDTWVPIQYAFITGPAQTQATLEIWDVTGTIPDVNPYFGSDFGMVGINLRQCASAVGIAKDVSAPVKNADGTYDVTYTLTLRNYGTMSEPVTNLQVTDDLARTFASARRFSIRSISSSSNLTLNPAYTGVSPNTGLLAPGNILASGDQGVATIIFTVRITPGSSINGRGPFANTAVVTANSGGATVEDDSVPGTAPDLDGNNNPKDPDEDGSTDVSLGVNLALPLVIRP